MTKLQGPVRARLGLGPGLLVVGLAAGALAADPARKVPAYALTGGRVMTVSGAIYDDATVVLRNGLIEDAGPSARVPPDARVIDAKGLTLTPGLIDGFSGLGLPAPSKSGRASGAPAGPADDPLAPQAMALDRFTPADARKARDQGLTTAVVVAPQGVLPGQSVLVNLNGDDREDMVLKQPFAMHLHLAELPRRYPNSLMGTMALARQSLLDARRYAYEWQAYERGPAGRVRPRYDAARAAWQGVVAGRLPLVVTASRLNDVRRALALADEFQLKVVVAGAPKAYRLGSLLKERKLPLLVSVNFDPPRASSFGEGSSVDEDELKRDIEDAEKNPVELHRAGVPFALVSGHAKSFLGGIQKAVEKGLPRDAALAAVTLRAAEVLGVSDRMGSLDKGKIANVVAWAGDPLAKDAKVKMVFVDGVLYEPEEKPESEKGGDQGKPEGEGR